VSQSSVTLCLELSDSLVWEILKYCSLCICSKDVRLPIQLQRAMAAEAEASREAKAKVRSRLLSLRTSC